MLCFLLAPEVVEVHAVIVTMWQPSQAKTGTLSRTDVQYLETNSVRRFGKLIVHAKRLFGSSKGLNLFPF